MSRGSPWLACCSRTRDATVARWDTMKTQVDADIAVLDTAIFALETTVQ
jgi:hypothetical protein